MEEAKALLADLERKFKNPTEKQVLVMLHNKHKGEQAKVEQSTKMLQDSIQLLRKKGIQLEAEIRKLSYVHSRKGDAFVDMNSQRLKLAKRIVELEDENEKLKAGLVQADQKIVEKEELIKGLEQPSLGEIYLEIVKGFGAEFLEKDGRGVCRIKSKRANDVFFVELGKEVPTYEICNTIWEKM
jgi:chromosome segregation ATPase